MSRISERARKETTTRKFLLSLRPRAGQLEEFLQVPWDYPPCFHIDHSVVDGVLQSTEFPGLRQQVIGCRFLHLLRQQLERFYSFFNG